MIKKFFLVILFSAPLYSMQLTHTYYFECLPEELVKMVAPYCLESEALEQIELENITRAKDDYPLLKFMITLGVDVSGHNGMGALWQAAYRGFMQSARLLIQNKTRINGHLYNTTPLCAAAISQELAMIHFLIEERADINLRYNSRYWTPLLAAVIYKKEKAVRILLDLHADKNIILTCGKCWKYGRNTCQEHMPPSKAIDIARRNGYHEIEKMLENN